MGHKGIFRDISWNLAAIGLPVAVALVAIPQILLIAGDTRLGLLTLAMAILGFAGIFDFGLSRAITKFVAERDGSSRYTEIPAYIFASLKVAGVISIGAMAVGLAGQSLLNDGALLSLPLSLVNETHRAFVLTILSIPLVVLSVVFRGALEGFGKFKTTALLRMLLGCATYGGPVIACRFTPDLSASIGSIVVARLAVTLILGLSCWRQIAHIEAALVPGAYRNLLSFGGWVALSNVISPLMTYLDRFAVAIMLGAGIVASYTVPYEVVTKALLIPAGVSTVLFQRLSALWEGARIKYDQLYRRALIICATGMFVTCSVLIVAGKPFLTMWVGAEFAQGSVLVWQILSAGVFCNAVAHIPYAALQASGRSDITARLHLVELPLYCVALIALTAYFGLIGAALAWALRAALDLTVLAIVKASKATGRVTQ